MKAGKLIAKATYGNHLATNHKMKYFEIDETDLEIYDAKIGCDDTNRTWEVWTKPILFAPQDVVDVQFFLILH